MLSLPLLSLSASAPLLLSVRRELKKLLFSADRFGNSSRTDIFCSAQENARCAFADISEFGDVSSGNLPSKFVALQPHSEASQVCSYSQSGCLHRSAPFEICDSPAAQRNEPGVLVLAIGASPQERTLRDLRLFSRTARRARYARARSRAFPQEPPPLRFAAF